MINQGSIDQSGTGATSVALSGTFSNTAAGSGQNSILRTSGDLKLTAQKIVNSGNSIILASQAAEVTAADISNENSTISAQNGNLTITADNLKNDGGFLKARQAFSLSSKQNSLTGTIDAGTDLAITNIENGSLTLAKNAVLRAGGDISVTAGVIDNAGVLLAQNDIIFTAGALPTRQQDAFLHRKMSSCRKILLTRAHLPAVMLWISRPSSQMKYRNLRLRIPVSALTKLQLQIS